MRASIIYVGAFLVACGGSNPGGNRDNPDGGGAAAVVAAAMAAAAVRRSARAPFFRPTSSSTRRSTSLARSQLGHVHRHDRRLDQAAPRSRHRDRLDQGRLLRHPVERRERQHVDVGRPRSTTTAAMATRATVVTRATASCRRATSSRSCRSRRPRSSRAASTARRRRSPHAGSSTPTTAGCGSSTTRRCRIRGRHRRFVDVGPHVGCAAPRHVDVGRRRRAFRSIRCCCARARPSSGTIYHAVRFTAENADIRNTYVWPARHEANSADQRELAADGPAVPAQGELPDPVELQHAGQGDPDRDADVRHVSRRQRLELVRAGRAERGLGRTTRSTRSSRCPAR